MDEFLQRLKERKLVQWALAYVAAAFALIQVLDVVAQRFGWPDALERVLILALALGFFVTLVVAWYYGEKGAQKVSGAELLILALLLGVGGGLLLRFARQDVATPPPAQAHAGSPSSVSSATAIPDKSVAVLPFVNESRDKDQQYFSDGLSEDLITALSQFAGLKVISRNSAFQFRDTKLSSAGIGQELGVAHLLEGTVQRQGDQVRITATLVRATDGVVIWTKPYDRPYKNLFALQDEITNAVADALKAQLLATPGAVVQNDRPLSGNLAAWLAFQKGNGYVALGTQASFHQAIDAYNEAIRIDPNYAAAYANLSFAWTSLGAQFLGGDAAVQAYGKARVAVAMALKLSPDSARAHQTNAYLLQLGDMDWTRAEVEARRALQLAPNDAQAKWQLGYVLATLGQNQQAVSLTRQALESDPRNAGWYRWLSLYLTGLNRLDEAKQAIDTAISWAPGAAIGHWQLATLEILHGDNAAALVAAQQETDPIYREFALALARQTGKDHASADAILAKSIEDYASEGAYQIAQVYALRRDADNTFKWLDRAWANRDPGLSLLLFDPFILRYKDDPRFVAFCKKVGLPATTDAKVMP